MFRISIPELSTVGRVSRVVVTAHRAGFPMGGNSHLLKAHIVPLIVTGRGVSLIGGATKRGPLMSLTPCGGQGMKVMAAKGRMFCKEVGSAFAPMVVRGVGSCNTRVRKRVLYGSSVRGVATTVVGLGRRKTSLVIYANNVDISPSSGAPNTVGGAKTEVMSCNTPMLPKTVFLLSCLRSNAPMVKLPKYIVCTGTAMFSLILPHVVTNVRIAGGSLTRVKGNKFYLNYGRYRCPGYDFKGNMWRRSEEGGRKGTCNEMNAKDATKACGDGEKGKGYAAFTSV